MPEHVAISQNTQEHIMFAWVRLGGKVTPISQDHKHPTELAPGDHELQWDFRGNPGDEGSIELWVRVGTKWAPYEPTLKVTMPGGITYMTSEKNPPKGYEPYIFTVE